MLYIHQCLDGVNIDKIKLFYSVGNPNFQWVVDSPNDMTITTDYADIAKSNAG